MRLDIERIRPPLASDPLLFLERAFPFGQKLNTKITVSLPKGNSPRSKAFVPCPAFRSLRRLIKESIEPRKYTKATLHAERPEKNDLAH